MNLPPAQPPLILSLTYPNTLWMLKNKKQLFPFKTWLLETWRCVNGAAEENTPGDKAESPSGGHVVPREAWEWLLLTVCALESWLRNIFYF